MTDDEHFDRIRDYTDSDDAPRKRRLFCYSGHCGFTDCVTCNPPEPEDDFLPNDIARCDGVGDYDAICEHCKRYLADRGKRTVMMTAPQFTNNNCPSFICTNTK